MKRFIPFLILVAVWSCDQITSTNDELLTEKRSATSYIQKGPYSVGSTIRIQSLDSNFQSSKQLPNSEIEDYTGKYFINLTGIETNTYLEVIAEGSFYNELSGKLSVGNLKLKGLGIADGKNINVNVLTHITNNRIIKLLKESNSSLDEVKKQVKNEVLKVFGVKDDQFSFFTDFSQANLLGATRTDAFLLASSVIFLGDENRTSTELEKILNDFSLDFTPDGEITNVNITTLLLDGKTKKESEINSVIENIKKYTQENNIPFNGSDIKEFFLLESDPQGPEPKEDTLKLSNKISNGSFTSHTDGNPEDWRTEIGSGGEGSINIVENNLVFNITDPGEESWSLYIATTKEIDLIDGKTYSIILDINSNKSDSKVKYALEGSSSDNSITKSYSDGWSTEEITGSTISKVFTYNEDEYEPYLAVQFGGDLTTPGSKIELKSCKIVEAERVDLNPYNQRWYTSELQDAKFNVFDDGNNNINIEVLNPGSNATSDWVLQLISPVKVPDLKNDDIYQLFFNIKSSGDTCKMRPILLSNDKDESIWMDHLGDFKEDVTVTSNNKKYSSKPFEIKNLQSENHHIKLYFGGSDLSHSGATYHISNISLYKVKK